MRTSVRDTDNTCLYCGKSLYGRTDKKFCNDQCRNTFNREKAQRDKKADHDNLPEIFRVIKKNYAILKTYVPSDPDEITWLKDSRELTAAGYNDKFFTSTWTDETGQIWHCCFDIGIVLGTTNTLIQYLPQQAEV